VVEDPRDGTLTGCGGWTFRNPTQADVEGQQKMTPNLRHFATRADMARKGVGSAIWDRSWQDIINMSPDGANTTLEVYSTLTAESFYASVGFQKVEELTVHIAEHCDFPCILMRREPSSWKGLSLVFNQNY
jgi:N-acetylglutamate synthase-like GNAT family acetyltransferase